MPTFQPLPPDTPDAAATPASLPPRKPNFVPLPPAAPPGWFRQQLQEIKQTPAPWEHLGIRAPEPTPPPAPAAGPSGSGAELRREYAPPSYLGQPGDVFEADPRPLWARGLETGITGVAATVGATGGAALGAPLGPVGAIPGAIAGAAATMTYADWINKKIDEKYGFAPVTPVTRQGLQQAGKENLIAATVGELGVPAVTKLAGGTGEALWGPHFEHAEEVATKSATPEEFAKSQQFLEQTQAEAKANAARVQAEARQKALEGDVGKEARTEAWVRQFGKFGRTPQQAQAARTIEPVQTEYVPPGAEPPKAVQPVAQPPPQPVPPPSAGPIPGRTGVGGPPLPPEPGQRVQTPTGSWVRPEAVPEAAAPAPSPAAPVGGPLPAAPSAAVEGGPATQPAPEFIKRRTAFYNSVFDPVNRSAKQLGLQFENLFREYLPRKVETFPMIRTIAEETAWAKDHLGKTEFSPAVERIFDEIDATGFRQGRQSPEQLNAMQQLADRMAQGEPLKPGQEPLAVARRPGTEARPTQQMFGQEVQRLLAWRTQIGELMPRVEGADKSALTLVRESIDDVLANSGVPGAKELRQTFRGFKASFGKDFYRGIGGINDPIDAIPTIMSDPQRSQQLFAAMTPGEKGVTREAFMDWMMERHPGGQFTNMTKARSDWNNSLKQLGFPAPFNDSESWIHLSELIPANEELFRTSPDALAKVEARMGKAAQEQYAKDAATELGVVKNEAGRLGGIAEKRINDAVAAGRTPEEKLIGARNALEALQGQDLKEQSRIAALRGEFGPPKTRGLSRMIERLNATVQRFGAYIFLIPGMFHKALALGAAWGTLRSIQAGVDAFIRGNPEMALSMYRALHTPLADSSLKTFANAAVKATVDAETARRLKAATGASLSRPENQPTNWFGGTPEPADTDETSRAGGGISGLLGEGTAYAAEPPAPRAMPAIREAQNREIAPSPAGADRAGEISKGLRTGGAPVDVTRDLERGRLSRDEVGKLLQREASPSPGAQVAGIPLPELLSAAETGNPQEKRQLVPLIQQRMQQELPKLTNKTMQANLARRFQRLQRDASVGMFAQPMQ